MRQGDEEKAGEKGTEDEKDGDDDVKTIEGVRLPEKKEIEETEAAATRPTTSSSRDMIE